MSRTKTVFRNSSETLHIWAQQNQPEGRCSNVFFEGATIFSYGRHYPLGHFAKNKAGDIAVLINVNGYSATTAKQIREAHGATNHLKSFDIPTTDLMRSLMYAGDNAPVINRAIVERVARLESQLCAESNKGRKVATIDKWKSEALSYIDNLQTLLNWFDPKAKLSKEARKAIASLGVGAAQLKTLAQKTREVEAAKRDKARKLEIKRNAAFLKQALPAWLSGIDHIETETGLRNTLGPVRQYASHTLLRVKGDEVETSQGARFPLSHGLKALPLIRAVVTRGEVWRRNGKTIHLGAYQIDSIEHGAIVAGCHTIPISEVERLAATIGA